MDFEDMPISSGRIDFLLTITDRFTKFVTAVACQKTISAMDVASALYTQWYLKGYGFPNSIISDRDGRFISKVWVEFCRLTGIERRMATSRHQQTDGQAESTVKIIKDALTKIVNHKDSRCFT